jgi:hypothetical protein
MSHPTERSLAMKLKPIGAALAATTMILCGTVSAQPATLPDTTVAPSGTMGGSGTLTPDNTGSTLTPQPAPMPAEVVPPHPTPMPSEVVPAPPTNAPSYGGSVSDSTGYATDPSAPRTRAEVKAETRALMHSGRIANGAYSVPDQDKGAERGLMPYPR